MEKLINIADIMLCPDCGSDDCDEYGTDEVVFGVDGTGYSYIHCRCNKCGKEFRLYTDFKYSVVKVYTK